MTQGYDDKESSRPRNRRWDDSGESRPDRDSFIRLAERVTELEVKQRLVEKQHARDLESIEKRMKEDLDEVKSSVRTGLSDLSKVTVSLDKNVQLINIALAEIKVRSSIIGAISAGVTFFLIMGLEWLKTKTEGGK